MRQEEDEVRRLLDVLKTLMRMLGISNREVERRLELKHGTVSRFLNGQIEPKLELVLGAARAIGLEYEELFAFIYPARPVPPPESAAARKIHGMLEDLRPTGSAGVGERPELPLDRSEQRQEVRQMVEEILKGMEKSEAETGNGG